MKFTAPSYLLSFSLSLVCMLCIASKCHEDTETAYKPLFMKRSELEASVAMGPPRELSRPGKIYYKDHIMFISESYKGIHVFNNSNPAAPVNMGFISVVGCLDLAIKGSTLYADNATDLVAINAADLAKPVVTRRIVDAFPEPLPPDELSVPVQYNKANRAPDLVLVDWIKK